MKNVSRMNKSNSCLAPISFKRHRFLKDFGPQCITDKILYSNHLFRNRGLCSKPYLLYTQLFSILALTVFKIEFYVINFDSAYLAVATVHTSKC